LLEIADGIGHDSTLWVKLTVKNIQNMISTRETTILLRGEDILGVAIEGGKERTITVSDQSVITASVKSFCGNSEQITYAWRLVSSQPPVEPGVIDFDSIINASL